MATPPWELLARGAELFNAGKHWEAHEAWEDLWRATGGPLRLFYQGLVQAAVGMHHLQHGNLNGGRSQLTKSIDKLSQYPPRFCRIDNGKLVEDLRQILAAGEIGSIVIVRDEKPMVESEG